MSSQLKPITHNSIVPISMGMLISMAVGLIWMAGLSFSVNADSKRIEKVESNQEAYVKNLQEIKEQLANIQGGLGIKYQPKRGQ